MSLAAKPKAVCRDSREMGLRRLAFTDSVPPQGRERAIPIPATLSLELGRVIGAQQENITYRFVSDFPFQNRAPHQLDKFETARPSASSVTCDSPALKPGHDSGVGGKSSASI